MLPEDPDDPKHRVLTIILISLISLIVIAAYFVRPWRYIAVNRAISYLAPPQPVFIDSVHVITGSHPVRTPPAPEALNPETKSEPLPTPPAATRPAPDFRPVPVAGSANSWEDWNASFSDTVTREYSAIFDSARLDTAGKGHLLFSPSGRRTNFLPVKQLFCIVQSVKPLVKYTFPGETVDFGIGVGFAASVSLKGTLEPEPGRYSLEVLQTDEDRFTEETRLARNQFTVLLNSSPGYSYTLRTGIECLLEDESGRIKLYYTPPATVEFRRMIRYQNLLRDAGDSVLVVTNNPAAIRDVLAAARRSIVRAVFVPLRDPSEADDLLKTPVQNLRLHVSVPRTLDRSFVVINDTEALVEKNLLDPEFKRTAELKLKGLQLNRIGLPRVTEFIQDTSAVQELKLLYLHFNRLHPQ